LTRFELDRASALPFDLPRNRVVRRMNRSLKLNFWEHQVDLHLPTPTDRDHFSFQFKNYMQSDSAPDANLHMYFTSTDRRPWIETLADPGVEKTITLVDSSRPAAVYDRWRHASTRVTPIPPIRLFPTLSHLSMRHGAAVSPPWNRRIACVIYGNSGAGKSSLLLRLLADGWSYVSDDLVLLNKGTSVMPYLRTMNIRDVTIRAHADFSLSSAIRAGGRAFNTPSGRTYLVHPADLGFTCTTSEAVVAYSIVLRHKAAFSVAEVGPRCAVMMWDALRDIDRGAAFVTRCSGDFESALS
jgi:hypothetical protein